MKTRIGYWAPLEGFRDPAQLIDLAARAEKVGFELIAVSDHFHPWTHTNAHSFFPWIWLSSLLERTCTAAAGTACTTPTMRYHPAIVAQAFASMASMYPGRVFLSVGTGERLNEYPLGFSWPRFRIRREMLEEAIAIIRELWTGRFVDFEGKYYTLRGAKLYDVPQRAPPLIVAASGEKMCQVAGRLGDGILTVSSIPHFKSTILPNLAKGAREAGKDPDSLIKMVEFKVSFDEDYDKALDSCRFWKTTGIHGHIEMSSDPKKLEEYASRTVTDDRIKELWFVTTDMDSILTRLQAYIDAGYTWIVVHSSSPDEETFIERFGEEVLPKLSEDLQE